MAKIQEKTRIHKHTKSHTEQGSHKSTNERNKKKPSARKLLDSHPATDCIKLNENTYICNTNIQENYHQKWKEAKIYSRKSLVN